jgi:hypothetical protein
MRLRMCGAILPLPHIPSWHSCLIKFWDKFVVVDDDDDGGGGDDDYDMMTTTE